MSSRLSYVFATASGNKTFSYNYASPTLSSSKVAALSAAIIANGEVFANVPTSCVSARIVTTSETGYSVDDSYSPSE